MASTSKELQWDQLPQLFSQILHLWNEAPAHNNWAMEKLMEIFCKNIAPDPNMVQPVGFSTFLEGFFESGQLIQYPDFVMINVALMAGEVLVNMEESSQEEDMKEKAFLLIRYPLQYWLVNKGHNVHVTFQILSKFVQHCVMLSSLSNSNFDLPQAIAYAVTSPHNYTRKSARTYFHDLIQFAFVKSDQSTDIQAKLRTTIVEYIGDFAKRLIQNQAKSNSCVERVSPFSEDKKNEAIKEAKRRFSLLVCQSAIKSQEWLETITNGGIFTIILELCSQIAKEEQEDVEGLYLTCAQIVVQLHSSCAVQETWTRHYHTVLQVVKNLCQQGSTASVTEVMGVAHTLLVGLGSDRTTERELLLELSLLPLFVLISAVPRTVHSFSPEIITQVKSMMGRSDMSRPLPMMKEAVKNMYSILRNEVLFSQEHAQLLRYLSFEALTEPAIVTRGLICGTQLRNDEVFVFAQYSLPYLQDLENKSPGHAENILKVINFSMKHPRLTHMHIQVAMDCYVKLIKDTGFVNSEVISCVIQILQLKMVDLDPNIQEAAVKASGNLVLLDEIDATSTQMLQCAISLWQCVEYKTEEVASQVLEFLLQASNIGKLDKFLSSVSVTQVEVVQKAEEFLVSGQWDNIKPVAFKLLTKLCTAKTMLKYAQASFQRYNAQLRVVVLDHLKSMFEEIYSKQLMVEDQVEHLISLLNIGWGDLLLDKAVSVETCNFRQISGIMENLLSFMERNDVTHYVDSVISGLVEKQPSTLKSSKGAKAFIDICSILLSAHGHTLMHRSGESCNGHAVMQNEFFNVSSQGEPPTKKVKCTTESPSSHVSENSIKTLSDKALHFLSFILNEAIYSEKFSEERRNVPAAVDVNAFDSTKELEPIHLSNEHALSRRIIHKFLSTEATSETEADRPCDIMTWLVYKEILHRLQPKALSTEAERSTDEYERNYSMLLHDFHQLLNKSFADMKGDLEKELISVFMTRISDILCQYELVKSLEEETLVLRSLIQFLQTLNSISSGVEKFCNFVFDHRKSVMVRPMQVDESQFILDRFWDRLQALSCSDARHLLLVDSYPSKEGLSLLLDEFCHESSKTSKDKLEDNKESSTNSIENSCSSQKKLEQIITCACKEVSTSKLSILDKITSVDIQALYRNLAKEFDYTSPEDSLKAILSEEKKKSLPPVLLFMNMLCKKFILVLFENDEHLKKTGTEETILLFSQLQAWFSSESEFDGENDDDPSALDCF